MSSSYRNQTILRCAATLGCIILGIANPFSATLAADTYVQPQLSVGAESHSNFDLVPGGSSESDVYGYIADLQALIGIATPRSDTSIRPRIRFQEYPDRDDFEEFEAFFDLRSLYRWERSQLLTFGRYSREDSYNAESTGGEFDPLDPNAPANPETGFRVVGETQSLYQIRPQYTFELSERTGAGVTVDYRVVRFDSDTEEFHDDYDYYGGNAFVTWSLDPRRDFRVGAYANRYEVTDDSTETDSFGGEIGYEFRWSEVAGIDIAILYEQNDTTEFVPVTTEESTSGWGGTFTAYRSGEVSTWRLTAGRTYIPTGARGKAQSDQIRLQYDRDITQRLKFTGAGRYEVRDALAIGEQQDDRDFARADISLTWMLAPTWFVAGGYSYIWEDRESATGSADNNKFFVNFGYKGLPRQRR